MNQQTNLHVTCTSCSASDACGAGCGGAHACGGVCARPQTRGLNRRDFIKMALAAGLLAGCAPLRQPSSQVTEPTSSPSPSPSPSPSGWSVLHEFTTRETKKYPRVAAFHDDAFGIMLLYPGGSLNTNDVRITNDGGQTWSEATSEDDYCRFGMDIVEYGVIWSCGRGTIHHPSTDWRSGVSLSTDEGRSWKNVSPIEGVGVLHPGGSSQWAAWSCHISFLDDQTGWVASKYTSLAATGNGGQSWSVLPLPESIPNIAAIHLRTPDEGYLLDHAGNLHTTRDAGQNWTSQELIRVEGMEMLTSRVMSDTAAIRFADKNNGLVATSILGDGGSECVVMRTSDGGKTWQKETLPVKLALTYYISRDCTLVTVTNWYYADRIVVLKYA